MSNYKLFTVSLLLVTLSGCSLFSSKDSYTVKQTPYQVSDTDQVSQRLFAHYQSWKGVPHRDGGLDRSGIDCSGFVQLTYRDLFNKPVPRTTESLSEKGVEVELGMMKTGDLVFFKTGLKRRHVGIYMGQNKFVHVSSKKGVMMSDLENPYWADAFWQVRRL